MFFIAAWMVLECCRHSLLSSVGLVQLVPSYSNWLSRPMSVGAGIGSFQIKNLDLVGLIFMRPRDQAVVDSWLEQKQQYLPGLMISKRIVTCHDEQLPTIKRLP